MRLSGVIKLLLVTSALLLIPRRSSRQAVDIDDVNEIDDKDKGDAYDNKNADAGGI